MENVGKKNIDIWKIVSIGILALYGLFLIYPLFKLLYNAFFANGIFTLENFAKFFSKSYYIESICDSWIISAFVPSSK